MTSVSDEWTPAEFDVLKELNAHAGRLATLWGFVLASLTFSFATGPLHDVFTKLMSDISPSPSLEVVLLFILAVITGIHTAMGFISVLGAMHPAIPAIGAPPKASRALLITKYQRCNRAAVAIGGSLLGLAGLWAFAMAVVLSSLFLYVCAGFFAVCGAVIWAGNRSMPS